MSIKTALFSLLLATFSLPLLAAGVNGAAYSHSGWHHWHFYHPVAPYYGGYNYNNGCGDWRDGKLACNSSIVIPDSTYDCNGWSCARTYCSTDCVWF